MSATVTRLLPAPSLDMPLAGLYLGENLGSRPSSSRPYIYTNFISSIDGRIAVGDDNGRGAAGVPPQLANPRDWRLDQELAVRADVIITSGRYVREFASGRAGPMLTYEDEPDMADLRVWRQQAGLPPKPAVAVVSRNLDFDERTASGISGPVVGIGSAATDPDRVDDLRERGIELILGESPEGVTGREIANGLARLGYQTAYSTAGPHIAHLLAADDVLDVLYVTYVAKLLGGRSYATLNEGGLLPTPPSMAIRSIYLDAQGAAGTDQLFVAFQSA